MQEPWGRRKYQCVLRPLCPKALPWLVSSEEGKVDERVLGFWIKMHLGGNMIWMFCVYLYNCYTRSFLLAFGLADKYFPSRKHFAMLKSDHARLTTLLLAVHSDLFISLLQSTVWEFLVGCILVLRGFSWSLLCLKRNTLPTFIILLWRRTWKIKEHKMGERSEVKHGMMVETE